MVFFDIFLKSLIWRCDILGKFIDVMGGYDDAFRHSILSGSLGSADEQRDGRWFWNSAIMRINRL